MAIESPLYHIGFCTASVSLASNQFYAVKITGAEQVGLVAATNDVVLGILQNTPLAGQAADVGFLGVSKCYAGASITAGNQLGVNTSGQIVTWSAGTVVGQALENSAASAIFTAFINCGTGAAAT